LKIFLKNGNVYEVFETRISNNFKLHQKIKEGDVWEKSRLVDLIYVCIREYIVVGKFKV